MLTWAPNTSVGHNTNWSYCTWNTKEAPKNTLQAEMSEIYADGRLIATHLLATLRLNLLFVGSGLFYKLPWIKLGTIVCTVFAHAILQVYVLVADIFFLCSSKVVRKMPIPHYNLGDLFSKLRAQLKRMKSFCQRCVWLQLGFLFLISFDVVVLKLYKIGGPWIPYHSDVNQTHHG